MSEPRNRPAEGSIFLDHSGHFVQDADAARAALQAMGFTVTPFSAQVVPDPKTGKARLTGTGNICVMLPEGYLEFLVHTADTPLGLEFRRAIDRHSGLHLLAFGVADAEAQHTALSETGLAMRPVVHFSRPVETEEGEATASFTVARLEAGEMPEGRVQFCTHHSVEAMWQPRWTRHANGAQRLAGLVVSTPDIEETGRRFAKVTGTTPEPFQTGLTLKFARGRLDILPEESATALTWEAVAPGQSAFVAVRLGVADIERFAAMDGARRVEDGHVALPFAPSLGRGAWLIEPF